MNWVWLLAASLFLHPVLEEDVALRFVARGVGDGSVEWYLDGVLVATTGDAEAVRVDAGAGEHDVWARTDHDGAWRALVRPEPRNGTGAAYVPSWVAEHPGRPAQGGVPDWLPWALGGLGAGALVWPRRPKDP